jgi:endonuclease YncB( thermonuclease family)
MRRAIWERRGQVWRGRDTLIAVAVLLIVGVLAVWLQPAPTAISGRAGAVDGDTLRFGAQRVRLLDLDAPELDQTCTRADGSEWSCGIEAKRFVAGLVDRGAVDCAGSGRDRYGRALAKCKIGGDDLGAQIVSAGWAVGDLGYSVQQLSARGAGRGLWSGNFVAPADWRRTHGTEQPGLWDWIRSWFQ